MEKKILPKHFPVCGCDYDAFGVAYLKYDDNLMADGGEISRNCDTLLGLIKTSFV